MKVRTKRKICLIIAAIGFFLVLGTAGASDMDVISFRQIFIQAAIGTALCAAGLYKSGYLHGKY